MKDSEKIQNIIDLIEQAKKDLAPTGEVLKGVHSTMKAVISYIDFMVNPWELTDDDVAT